MLASMRPARKGPEKGQVGERLAVVVWASMRPARKGPEKAGMMGDAEMNAMLQ